MNFELAWDTRCQTGESCVWDAVGSKIWFCDIPAGVIRSLQVTSGERAEYQLPGPVGSFAICASGELLVALRDDFVIFDPVRRTTKLFATIPRMNPDAQLNDGKTGPDGCFWVGTTDSRVEKEDIGVLYRVRPDGHVEAKSEGFKTSNGLAWSPDGRTMYHADSRGSWIDAWNFDASSGQIGGRRRLATLTAEDGRPDGAACDARGNYWSAGVSAGCLNCFSPAGRLLKKVKVPVPAPTMPCFVPGGMFLTSLTRGGSQQRAPSDCSGSLFFASTDVPGAPIPPFEPL